MTELRRLRNPKPLQRAELRNNTIVIGDLHAPFVVRRSKRARRVGLRVDPHIGTVTLVLPMRASEQSGWRFVAENTGWIAERLATLPPAMPFADGNLVPLYGQPHRIRHRPDLRGTVWLQDNELHVAGRVEHLPRRLHDWFVAAARRELSERAERLAGRIGRDVQRVTIRDSRTRWGSCSSAGSLTFSWRLLLAPDFVIEYTVAHEVAHLMHMNHGRRFWQLVAQLSPEVEAARAWLRRHGAGLHRYG